MRNILFATLFPLLLVLPGCASAPQDEVTVEDRLAQRGYQRGEAVRSIQNYRLDGWHFLDSRNLMIETGPRQRYLVQLRVPCPELSTANSIGFTSTAGQLTHFDKIVLEEASGTRRDCIIDQLYRLNPLESDSREPDPREDETKDNAGN